MDDFTLDNNTEFKGSFYNKVGPGLTEGVSPQVKVILKGGKIVGHVTLTKVRLAFTDLSQNVNPEKVDVVVLPSLLRP